MTIHQRRGSGYGWYRFGFAIFAVCLVVAVFALASGSYSVKFTPLRPILGLLVVGAIAVALRWRSGRG
jgi:hypothetical protein